MKVGFIGLGQMGAPMAARLIAAGHELTVYNRSSEKARPLGEQGARVATRVADACDAEVVFTMLANDQAVEQVVFGDEGLLRHLPPGAVHVSSSTIGVALAERLARTHAEADRGFVAAPVFGRPTAAAAGQLFVVAAGAAPALDRVAGLFEAVGQRTFVVASDPAAAALVKLSGNFLIASVIESLGEAFALVDKGGVDRQQYLELLTSTLFGAPVYKTYGGLIADRQFEPAGFAAPLGLKDIGLVLAASESLRVPMPVASLLRDRFLTLLAHGGDRLDWAALGDLAGQDAGLVPGQPAR